MVLRPFLFFVIFVNFLIFLKIFFDNVLFVMQQTPTTPSCVFAEFACWKHKKKK